MIAVIDYGLGNVKAFVNIYNQLNIAVKTAVTVDELAGANKIILPGVGAFDWAMKRLAESGMRAMLDYMVLIEKTPILGICVGMQMMAQSSEEGDLKGLGWFNASVNRFDSFHLPHLGWNNVNPLSSDLFKGLECNKFYFLHSYYFFPKDPDQVIATSDYSRSFASAVATENIYGVQFHPEKSHHQGIQLLKNFAEI